MLATQASFPNEETFVGTINFCFLLKKLVTSCNNEKRHSLDLKYPRLCLELLKNEKKVKSFDCNDIDESTLNNDRDPQVKIWFVSQVYPSLIGII